MVRPCAKYARLNCEHRQKIPTAKRRRIFYVGLPTYARRGLFGLGLCRNKYKRAIIARFRNVAEGNISRLRDAQAFHAAVKRPPYFMFARQRRHFTAGRSVSGSPSPRLRGLFGVGSSPMDSVPQLLRTDKQTTAKNAVAFCRLALTPLARSDLGLVEA